MANHCIEVICSKCGAVYCLRGCNFNYGPDKKFLKKWLKDNPKPHVFIGETHCQDHPTYHF